MNQIEHQRRVEQSVAKRKANRELQARDLSEKGAVKVHKFASTVAGGTYRGIARNHDLHILTAEAKRRRKSKRGEGFAKSGI